MLARRPRPRLALSRSHPPRFLRRLDDLARLTPGFVALIPWRDLPGHRASIRSTMTTTGEGTTTRTGDRDADYSTGMLASPTRTQV